MDPLSQLFAAYLHTVSNSISEVYVDSMNTTVTSQSLVYNDTNIRFQHQLWKIKPNSVCSDLEQQATQFSKCTQQAKAMFTELCNQLSSMENLSQKGRSLSNMYCNASLTYKPMIAYISEPKQKTEQELKEKECNLMILKAMQDNSDAVRKQKDEACGKTG
jgi:iron uptake system EfeUOB component EfeO/EfeM|tara:strand:+ start:75307 stop:75789 length:483 start_codon:yes stop_codon:yes gene_type:complete